MTTDDKRPDKEEEETSPADGDRPKPAVPVDRCTCGIEVSRATALCTEQDCPFRR